MPACRKKELVQSDMSRIVDHNFVRLFMALAIAKLDFAMICRDSFVTSGKACTSLSLFAWSLSSRRISLPCFEKATGILSLHTATILDTIVIICVRFSVNEGEGVGLRTADKTLWIAKTIASVWASRYGYTKASRQKQHWEHGRNSYLQLGPSILRSLKLGWVIR